MGTGFCGTTLVLSIYCIIATLVVIVLSVVIHQGPETQTRVVRPTDCGGQVSNEENIDILAVDLSEYEFGGAQDDCECKGMILAFTLLEWSAFKFLVIILLSLIICWLVGFSCLSHKSY